MVDCNLNFILQIVTIIAGAFGIIVAIVCICSWFSVPGLILDIFVIFFCLCIIFSELYVFSFFKYIAFIATFWGKGTLYLFIGFFLFSTSGIGLAAAIIFWALFIFYIIVAVITKTSSPPLLQKNSQPNWSVSNEDYFGDGVGEAAPATNVENNAQPQQSPNNDYGPPQ